MILVWVQQLDVQLLFNLGNTTYRHGTRRLTLRNMPGTFHTAFRLSIDTILRHSPVLGYRNCSCASFASNTWRVAPSWIGTWPSAFGVTHRPLKFTAKTTCLSLKWMATSIRSIVRTSACWPSSFSITRRCTTTWSLSSSMFWPLTTAKDVISLDTFQRRSSVNKSITFRALWQCRNTSDRDTAVSSSISVSFSSAFQR